jgi:hypothetical protein
VEFVFYVILWTTKRWKTFKNNRFLDITFGPVPTEAKFSTALNENSKIKKFTKIK